MKNKKKIISVVLVVALAVVCYVPVTAKASSSTIPSWTMDFNLEGRHVVDDPYMAGDYSLFKLRLINGTLTFKFDAECSLPKSKRYVVYLMDGATDKKVESFYLYAINNQYKTFNNLTSSSYYLKYSNGYDPDIVGCMYASSDNLFY